MDPATLERRAHPRTHAFVPTTIRHESQDEQIPVHMLDLSAGGAGLMAGAGSAPNVGQYLYVRFESNDEASEGKPREELALVVNVRRPEDSIARVGVRFVHRTDLGTTRRGPKDLLLDHRRTVKKKGGLSGDRWSFLKSDSSRVDGQAALSGTRS